MHKNIAIKLHNISKVYKLYDKPIDRLKEALHPLKKKYHKDFYALKNINLEIKKGEVLGIVGVNGAGKSTLLKIIAGVLTPTSGRITVHGKLNAILELGSGLKPEMTGLQNIKLNLQINGIYENIEQLTEEIIEFADIGEHINQPIKTYSSGMKSRLGFAIATSTDPDILIVDEVLAVGDVLFQRKCYGKIEKLFKDGKTVIFVSHSAQSVIEFCSRAVLLYDREIIMDDTPKKVTDLYQKLVFSKDKEQLIDNIKIEKLLEPEKISNQVVNKKEKYFLSSLKVEPELVNSHLAEFKNICILNKENKNVNFLKIYEEYTIQYDVIFKKSLNDVQFSVQIFTLKGLLINGSNTKDLEKKTFNVRSNEVYSIQMVFKCFLVAGDYFINISFADREKTNVAIIKNSYIFKVEQRQCQSNGIVNLENKFNINILNN